MTDQNKQEVRKGEELPVRALQQFLYRNDLISVRDTPLSIKQYTHGYSNLTYRIKAENQTYVLRRPPFGAIKRGHDMAREYKVQKAIKTQFSKVARMYTYSEDKEVMGAPFYLMECIDGIILNYPRAKKMDLQPTAFGAIAETWLDTFIELHKIDYKAAGLEPLGRPEGYVTRQVTNWGKQYLKAATDKVPEAEMVMRWMEEKQPKEYRHCLIHNDYKYDNVVFKDDQWKEIYAVLDWEMATLGDPLMDLGTSLGYWTVHSDHDMIKQGIPSPTIFDGNPKRSEIVEHYAQKSGIPIDHLVFYYVYGLFKIAVIAQQIYYRFKHGYTTDPRFAELNKAAALCCKLALRAIQTQKID